MRRFLKGRDISEFIIKSESLVSLALKIWELIPDSIKGVKTLSVFKNKIKAWTTDKCPCRLCKYYIGQVGFI